MDLSWMAWTWPTAIFFVVIALLLLTFTVLAIRFPEEDVREVGRSARGVRDQAGKAALAAAIAALVSASPPSEMVAKGSSVEGFRTARSRPSRGATQAPLM